MFPNVRSVDLSGVAEGSSHGLLLPPSGPSETRWSSLDAASGRPSDILEWDLDVPVHTLTLTEQVDKDQMACIGDPMSPVVHTILVDEEQAHGIFWKMLWYAMPRLRCLDVTVVHGFYSEGLHAYVVSRISICQRRS